MHGLSFCPGRPLPSTAPHRYALEAGHPFVYLVYDYMEGGNLADALVTLTETQRVKVRRAMRGTIPKTIFYPRTVLAPLLCSSSVSAELAPLAAFKGRTLTCFAWISLFKVLLDVCDGLRFCHEGCGGAFEGDVLLHRDVKPDNVLLRRDPVTGELVAALGDFGISKLFPARIASDGAHATTQSPLGTLG